MNADVVGEQILDFFERRSTRARVWSVVAEQKRGEYRPPRGGFFGRTKPALYAEVADVMVQVTLRSEGSGDSQETFTIISAPWLLGAGPELKVLQAGVFRRMGRALGLQDVPTGDRAFDDNHVVKAISPQIVPHVLGPRARRRLQALSRGTIHCSVARVELKHSGVITDAPRLSLVIDTVAEIAAYGSSHVQTLAQLPGRFIAPQGPWSSRIAPYTDLELSGSRVRAMAVSYPHGIYYALRAQLQRDVPELVLAFVDGVPNPTPPEGLFDPETFGTLVSLGNLTLRTRQGVAQLELPGSLDTDALTRAARWLSHFVDGRRQGAFR